MFRGDPYNIEWYSYDFHQKMYVINITKFTNLLKSTLLIYHTV